MYKRRLRRRMIHHRRQRRERVHVLLLQYLPTKLKRTRHILFPNRMFQRLVNPRARRLPLSSSMKMIAAAVVLFFILFSCASAFTAVSNGGLIESVPLSEEARIVHHKRHQNPSRTLSILRSTINDDTIAADEKIITDNPLKSAGLSFVSASTKSLGMVR